MSTLQLNPINHPELFTLELGASTFGASIFEYEHELKFQPLPPEVEAPAHARGLIRLGDGTVVPVFDLRSPAGQAGRYRLVITVGSHDDNASVGMAVLLDAIASPALPPRPRTRPDHTFGRN